jgi:hypothetical protein
MRNLLQIEERLLGNPQVKAGLRLAEIKTIARAESNAQKRKFAQTMKLAVEVSAAFEWFQSDEGRAIFSEEGVSWNTEEFAKKAYGYEKSYFYKLTRAAAGIDLLETFEQKCAEAEAEGLKPNRSLAGFLKFIAATNSSQANGEGSEGEGGEGEGEATEPSVETTASTILTFSFKAKEIGGDRNVAVRINKYGEVTTSNTPEEVANAIAFLTQCLTA